MLSIKNIFKKMLSAPKEKQYLAITAVYFSGMAGVGIAALKSNEQLEKREEKRAQEWKQQNNFGKNKYEASLWKPAPAVQTEVTVTPEEIARILSSSH